MFATDLTPRRTLRRRDYTEFLKSPQKKKGDRNSETGWPRSITGLPPAPCSVPYLDLAESQKKSPPPPTPHTTNPNNLSKPQSQVFHLPLPRWAPAIKSYSTAATLSWGLQCIRTARWFLLKTNNGREICSVPKPIVNNLGANVSPALPSEGFGARPRASPSRLMK